MLGMVAANHAALTAIGMWPRSQAFGPTMARLAKPGPRVALTFDDGPDPDITPRVLDLLDRHRAQASFFCIGERARSHPALIRQIIAAGHGVENHSLTHSNLFACFGPAALRREVEQTQAILADAAGRPPGWFRSPMGFRNPMLADILQQAGLRAVAWTRRGYDTRTRDPGAVLGRLLRRVTPGDILLLHDGNAARTPCDGRVVLETLPPLLATLAVLGLTAAALPDARADWADAA